MKTIHKYTYLLIVTLLMFSCSNDDDTTPPENPVVTINSISPTSGPKTTIVTISGNHFGEDLNAVQVFFNEKEATVNQVSNTEIIAVVPPKAFTGNVTIKVNDTELTGPEFNYVVTEVVVSTYAGSTLGFADGTIANAKFNSPTGGAFDSQGNLFVADSENHKIRKITPSGVVSTFAGSTQGFADGQGINAKFNEPYNIAIDAQDNLYVSDTYNFKIRKITPNGVVTSLAGSTQGFADGIGGEAKFGKPKGLILDADNNLLIADEGTHKIRKLSPNGVVSTIVGTSLGDENGNISIAKLSNVTSLCLDDQGNLLITDASNNKIKKLSTTGNVSTYSGSTAGLTNGNLLNAQFNYPYFIVKGSDGRLYISDYNSRTVRQIENGVVTTLAGTGQSGSEDGLGANASFYTPHGVAIGKDHTLYVFDTFNHRIRKITQE